ncbi:hypothetical protein D3C76_1076290 [compost metagenome]
MRWLSSAAEPPKCGMLPKAAPRAASTTSSRLERPSSRVRAKLWSLIGARELARQSCTRRSTSCWASIRPKRSISSTRALPMEKLRWSKPTALTQLRP